MTWSGITGTLVSWLLGECLLEQVRLFVFPVAPGRGKRLLAESATKVPLKLAASAAFETGMLNLTHDKA
jgi:hypothetical protein